MTDEPRVPTRVAVVGVGQLGARHAGLYAEISEAELVGVADIDDARCAEVAASLGVAGVHDFRELLSSVEAVSVAVPTVAHEEVATELMEAGVHVLVEKPIAVTSEQARRMVAVAKRHGVRLGVGHTERYNPAVEAVLSQASDPRFIEVHRLGSFSPRSLDIDVVRDLMIHDLDVVAALVGREVSSIEAVGVPVLTPRVDIANARLRFDGGAVANITASRVSTDKIRKLRIFERDRYVSLDYQAQSALCYQVAPSESRERPDIRREELVVAKEEPLKRELLDFLEAVAENREPRVDGEEGAKALDLALGVIAAMEAAAE